MSEHERMLVQLGEMLSKIARPCQLGFPCNELTSREELIARLWARKRTLQTAIQPEWGGPGVTPPTAA